MDNIPTHPGDVLKEEIKSRGISQHQFADMLGVSYTMLNEILNCKRPVTPDFALLVEACLGINPKLLINMQSRYDLACYEVVSSMKSIEILAVFVEYAIELIRPSEEIGDAITILMSKEEELNKKRFETMIACMMDLEEEGELKKVYLTDLAEEVVKKMG